MFELDQKQRQRVNNALAPLVRLRDDLKLDLVRFLEVSVSEGELNGQVFDPELVKNMLKGDFDRTALAVMKTNGFSESVLGGDSPNFQRSELAAQLFQDFPQLIQMVMEEVVTQIEAIAELITKLLVPALVQILAENEDSLE